MAGISLETAYMTSIWIESILYGLNLKFYITYVFLIVFKNAQPRQVNRVILYAATAMILLSTAHVSIGFYRILEGFVYRRNFPGGPGAFIANVSLPHSIAMLIVQIINSMLGDSIVIWRCYIIWDRNWKVILPLCLLILATTACGFGQASVLISEAPAALRHLNTGYSPQTFFSPALAGWASASYFLSLFTNLIATFLIAVRIWFINRRLSRLSTQSSSQLFSVTRRVLSLVAETGLIYSSFMIVQIILYFIQSNAFFIIYDPMTQIMGITPLLILVWTGLGYGTRSNTSVASNRRIASVSGSTGEISKFESQSSFIN